ncbi:MAG: cytochrome c peroxidase [Myxococcota bacterium]
MVKRARETKGRAFWSVWLLVAAAWSIGCIVQEDPTDPGLPEHMDVTQFAQIELSEHFEPLEASAMPASPTNRFADDPLAAAMGEELFFDRGLSADGSIGCVSCHNPGLGFSDARSVSVGVGGREGRRLAPGIWNVGYLATGWTLWDGRADSLWVQPLLAIEDSNEHDFSRVEVYHYIRSEYAQTYREVFGPLPDLEDLPQRAMPGMPEWELMSEVERAGVNQVFANVGKSIEAFERTLVCADTRFDRFLRGEQELDEVERLGARAFVASGCQECHSGALFTDGGFHNIGIGSRTTVGARGREAGAQLVWPSVFNGAGPYSDDRAAGSAKLTTIQEEGPEMLGAFKTPSLRGVGQRAFFMHNGSFGSLDSVMAFYADAEDAPAQNGTRGVHDAKFLEVDVQQGVAIIAFLRTLDCRPHRRTIFVGGRALDPGGAQGG